MLEKRAKRTPTKTSASGWKKVRVTPPYAASSAVERMVIPYLEILRSWAAEVATVE
jgi:hypothetical protein